VPAIRYRTDNVPRCGRGAFTPIPIPTPLASTGGEQMRSLQQWTDAPDPNLAGRAVGCDDTELQGSYATKVAGLPGAFRPVINHAHSMAYVTTPRGSNGEQTMGPNGSNTHMKIWSDNPLPVPAVNPGRVSSPAMRATRAGTIIATAWPRPFISWPTWGTSRQA